MMDPSVKKDCDQMIVEAIRMARENKDRAYLFEAISLLEIY